MPGYLNVDIRDLPGVNYLADVRHLPPFREPITRIYAGHIVEHIPWGQSVAAIGEWWDLLGEGGELTITIPDVDKATLLFAEGQIAEWELVRVVGGDRSTGEMYHRSAWSLPILQAVLESLPDARVDCIIHDPRCPAWPAWQTTLRATRLYRD